MPILAKFYTKKELKDVPAEDFAGPDKSFPIIVRKDVADAWDLAGHADDPDAVREKIKEIAKRKGWEDELPSTAKMARFGMSMMQLQSGLLAALGDDPDNDGDEDWPWIVDVSPDDGTFIYGCDTQTYQQGYRVVNGQIELVGEPEQVRASPTVWEPVARFASEEKGVAIYRGEIFRIGQYPDKGCPVINRADLKRVAANMQGKVAPIQDQHVSTPFSEAISAKSGFGLTKVVAMDDGEWLYGEIRVPSWVRDALGDELKPSVFLDMAGERPQGILEISPVLVPRVDTARMELAAAFAKFAGARNNKTDAKAIQSVHDLACSLGATCEPASAQMSGSRQHNPAANPAKGGTMNPFQKILAAFRRKPEAMAELGLTEADLSGLDAPQNGANAQASPEFAAALDTLNARFEAAEKQLAATRMATLDAQATQFARAAVSERKALPAEQEELKKLFVMAAKSDGNGAAQFSAETGELVEGENLKVLKASIAKRQTLAVFSGQQISDRPGAEGLGGPAYTAERVASAKAAGGVEAYNRRR